MTFATMPVVKLVVMKVRTGERVRVLGITRLAEKADHGMSRELLPWINQMSRDWYL